MSEKLCTLRTKGGGGGKYTETSLWTNPSLSSAFAAQTVTLSDSLSNYKYVAIKYKYAGTTDGVNDPMSVIVPVDKFKTSLKNNSTRHNILVLGTETNGNAGWTRNVFYASDTTIEFDTGYRQNAASSSGDICVPTEILGLNELATGHKLDRTLLWTNNSPTTSMSTTFVTLSDDMRNYDYIAVKYRNSTSDATEFETVMKTSELITNAMYIGVVAGSYMTRRVNQYTDYTTMRITGGMQPGSTVMSNTACIPTAIYGVKLS